MSLLLSTPRKIILLAGLLTLSLACNLLSGFQQSVKNARSTAFALATEARGGSEVIATAQAVVTQLADSQIIETAKAVATEVSQSGAVETLQAVISEQAPGLDKTLQALTTQGAPAFQETTKALLTQVPPLQTSAPSDIPLPEIEKENFVVTPSTISFVVALPYAEVVSFYKNEMPKQGWAFEPTTSQESENSSLLNFTKENRFASISINRNPANQKTIVVIALKNP